MLANPYGIAVWVFVLLARGKGANGRSSRCVRHIVRHSSHSDGDGGDSNNDSDSDDDNEQPDPGPSSTQASTQHNLSDGAIAGIVVGVVALLLLLLLLLLLVWFFRRYHRRQQPRTTESLESQSVDTKESNETHLAGEVSGVEYGLESTVADGGFLSKGSDLSDPTLTSSTYPLNHKPSSFATSRPGATATRGCETNSDLAPLPEMVSLSNISSSIRRRDSTDPQTSSPLSDFSHQLLNPHESNDLVNAIASSAYCSPHHGEGSWVLGCNDQTHSPTPETSGRSRHNDLQEEVTVLQKQLESRVGVGQTSSADTRQEPPPRYPE